MLHSPGLRLSLSGAAVFLVSIVALVFLPSGGPIIGMLIGGMCVWLGFLWTLYGYYFPASKPPTEG